MNALQAVAENDLVTLRIIISYANCTNNYNLEEVDFYGNTPLLKACYMNRLECVHILLAFGANINAINYLGKFSITRHVLPICFATQHEPHLNGNIGQNALTLATFVGNQTMISELLRYRSYADFNKSSLIPAICVATLRQQNQLIEFFKSLDDQCIEDIETVHGLNCSDLNEMLCYLNSKNV